LDPTSLTSPSLPCRNPCCLSVASEPCFNTIHYTKRQNPNRHGIFLYSPRIFPCRTHMTTLGGVLVWDSPRREGVLPAGDNRGNWNVTWFPADV
jgi:hypothetical protein